MLNTYLGPLCQDRIIDDVRFIKCSQYDRKHANDTGGKESVFD